MFFLYLKKYYKRVKVFIIDEIYPYNSGNFLFKYNHPRKYGKLMYLTPVEN